MPGIDGRSLVPLFARTPADWRKSFLIEYTTDIVFPRTLKMGYDAVRTERYKYIRYRDLKDMNELYDLLEDPFELSNLIAAPTATPASKWKRNWIASSPRPAPLCRRPENTPAANPESGRAHPTHSRGSAGFPRSSAPACALPRLPPGPHSAARTAP
jgi:hypothetical protein